MNKELQQYLFVNFKWFNYPTIKNRPIMPIQLGIDCNDGWFNLIKLLAEDIDKELKTLPKKIKKDFYVDQIKEKFGGLRFYTSFTPNEKIGDLINKAEEDSYLICENCGKPGKLRDNIPWALTLCNKCFIKKKKERLNDQL